MDPEKQITEILGSQGIELKEDQAHRLKKYYDLIVEKNKVMNLTRITDFQEAVEKHFADSLMIMRYIEMNSIHTVLDLGSGAGFPGIPLKILCPHLHILMIDSVGKKMQFVSDVIQELALKDAKAMHARAEELAVNPNYREKYDLCVSRAVANLSTLSEYCLPFIKIGGIFAAYKSADSEDEIKQAEGAVRKLGGGEQRIETFDLFGMGRTLAFYKKCSHTPRNYPRKAGIPSKDPLK